MRAGGGLRHMAGALGLWLLVVGLGAGLGMAQDAPVTPSAANTIILTVNQDRLFTESAFGKASLDRERAETAALDAENKQIEAALIAEEQGLTTRRATLPAAEFAALAAAFDAKVERIRAEQDTKLRDLTRLRDEERQAFLRAIVPVLGEMMGERGAVAILAKSTVIVSLTAIDVTDAAIARVDAVLPLDPAISPPAAATEP